MTVRLPRTTSVVTYSTFDPFLRSQARRRRPAIDNDDHDAPARSTSASIGGSGRRRRRCRGLWPSESLRASFSSDCRVHRGSFLPRPRRRPRLLGRPAAAERLVELDQGGGDIGLARLQAVGDRESASAGSRERLDSRSGRPHSAGGRIARRCGPPRRPSAGGRSVRGCGAARPGRFPRLPAPSAPSTRRSPGPAPGSRSGLAICWRMRPPSKIVWASEAASERMTDAPPVRAASGDPFDTQRAAEAEVGIAGRRQPRRRRAVWAASVRSAARTSGRWRRMSAGMPIVTDSGTAGTGASAASRSSTDPGAGREGRRSGSGPRPGSIPGPGSGPAFGLPWPGPGRSPGR